VTPCVPTQDQTCNADPAMNALAGHCNLDQTCTCAEGHTKQADGKCK
jgi:hypothetical protein